jgi:2'-5' RNA ligase
VKGLPDTNRDIYFIAIIPNCALREEIRKIKERIRDEYGAGHALKSPAHITLQMPFKRSSTEEGRLSVALKLFTLAEKDFIVETDGYGAFPPRVIYVRITDPEPVRSLHCRLRDMLLSELGFSQEETMKDIKPHITVATRDLTKAAFSDAWAEFREEKITGHFEVGSIFLLKHNGRNWDILEEFPFGER